MEPTKLLLPTLDDHLDLIAWAYDHADPETLDWLSLTRPLRYPAVIVVQDNIAADLLELVADWEEVLNSHREEA
jgi:hypothetical protein